MTERLHLHLDPLGGIAGDMVVAALLDAWPEHAEGAIMAARLVGLGEEIEVAHRSHGDGVLVGSRFEVARDMALSEDHGHGHVHWRSLRDCLLAAALEPAVCARAVAIFSHLAEAEAAVHGVAVEAATFHEVGAWDSIADIVATAYLIERIGAKSWSVGPLPLGGGRVRSAHGDLPVPAPATARLLEGFVFHDDGRSGERVTPTGAAILKQLGPAKAPPSAAMRLLKTGHGFGQRRLEGMSNVLRVLAFEKMEDETGPPATTGDIAVLSFEIDDQTAEDLAIGLDYLRALDGVLDLVQTPVFGKKGRMMTSLRLLTRPDTVERVIEACFAETTTLGVRWHIERRAALPRTRVTAEGGVLVKLAERPGGRTAKAESADLADMSGHRNRDRVRRSAEEGALDARPGEEDSV